MRATRAASWCWIWMTCFRAAGREYDCGAAAEHIEYQCETLPYRFVGTRKPTNTLETVCQEITESYDDDMLAAALMPTARGRRRALHSCATKVRQGIVMRGTGVFWAWRREQAERKKEKKN